MTRLTIALLLFARLASAQITEVWAPTTTVPFFGSAGGALYNVIQCVDWTPLLGISGALSFNIALRGTASDNCEVALYDGAGISKIATTGGVVCNAPSASISLLHIAVSAFSFTENQPLRLCWCGDSTFGSAPEYYALRSIGVGESTDLMNGIAAHVGTAGSCLAGGRLPAQILTITPDNNVTPMIVRFTTDP